MAEKILSYADAVIRVAGRAGDPYFDSLDLADHSNDFYANALNRLQTGAVVFDVGANVGLTAAMAAMKADRVYAFEPSPTTFSYLSSTIEISAISERVEAYNCGLGDRNGELNFFEDQTSGSASHLITSDTLARQSSIKVPVQTLDHFVSQKSIDRLDLIKIDVEGFEIDVLRGAAETIRRLRPSALIEFNSFTMVGFRDINPRTLLTFIRQLFPHVYRWNGAPLRIESDADALGFIHDNLVSAGCVDDLYGTFKAI